MSGSASFQSAKKSSWALRLRAVSPESAAARARGAPAHIINNSLRTSAVPCVYYERRILWKLVPGGKGMTPLTSVRRALAILVRARASITKQLIRGAEI